MDIEKDIDHFKRYKSIPNGSVIVFKYGKNCVAFVASSELKQKKTSEGLVDTWVDTSMENWLNGTNGVVLSRAVDGRWDDRPEAIEWLKGYLDRIKKEVKGESNLG